MIQPIAMKPAAAAAESGASNSAKPAGAAQLGQQFGEMLKNAMDSYASQQQDVTQLTQRVAGGDLSAIQNLMVASEKASLSLDLTVQVRNKVIDAYQEIMRMQV